MAPRRARIGVSVVFLVCGAAFATWAARVPAAQEQLGLTEGELALGLFGLSPRDRCSRWSAPGRSSR